MAIRPALNFVVDLLFPILCQSCGAEGEYLCLSCQGAIEPPVPKALPGIDHLKGLLVAAEYKNDGIRRLIWHLKFNSVRTAAPTLARLLADYLVKTDILDYFTAAAVIPVPMYHARQKGRGYNQAELIAENLAGMLGLGYCPILKKIRPTKSQVDLPREERIENIRGSFAASSLPSLGERKILLIDDVATTGATLNECARELKKQSAAEIWGLVVARN